jgi:phosphoglucomutase
MIALLIGLHDGRVGIAGAKVGGGDFILEKEWDGCELTVETTLRCMKLTAARDTIEIGRQEYVELLRREFVRSCYYEDEADRDKSIVVNWKARVPMSEKAIELGIEIARKVSSAADA